MGTSGSEVPSGEQPEGWPLGPALPSGVGVTWPWLLLGKDRSVQGPPSRHEIHEAHLE